MDGRVDTIFMDLTSSRGRGRLSYRGVACINRGSLYYQLRVIRAHDSVYEDSIRIRYVGGAEVYPYNSVAPVMVELCY